MKKRVRYFLGATALVPGTLGLGLAAPGVAQAAGCTGNTEFWFSTQHNARLKGHGWYTRHNGTTCIGTVDISMKYNKSLSKAAYVLISAGNPLYSSRKTTGLVWEPAGTWLKHSFGFHRSFPERCAPTDSVCLSLFSYPYGDVFGSYDHATVP
jgi:hypothetical protein